MIIFLFGLPGVGKNFLGDLISKKYGLPFYDGDNEMGAEAKKLISEGKIIPQKLRDEYFQKIIYNMLLLKDTSKVSIVVQTLAKEENRKQLLDIFKDDIKFVFLTADKQTILRRLKARKNHIVKPEYLETVITYYEDPDIPHIAIDTGKGLSYIFQEMDKIIAPLLQ